MKRLFNNIKDFFKGFKYGIDTGCDLLREGGVFDEYACSEEEIRFCRGFAWFALAAVIVMVVMIPVTIVKIIIKLVKRVRS